VVRSGRSPNAAPLFVTWLRRTHWPATSTDDPAGMVDETAIFVIRWRTNTTTATTATRTRRRGVTPSMLEADHAPGLVTMRMMMIESSTLSAGPTRRERFT